MLTFSRRQVPNVACLLLVLTAFFASLRQGRGDEPEARPANGATETGAHRVLKQGELPADRRLGPLKTYDGYFPFVPPASPEAWEARADRVRKQILVATGLWPMPEKRSLNAVIHGKVDRDDYTVEKVYFESYSGHFVTGNLYRPKGRQGKLPGVLCPYGHWGNGRFQDEGAKKAEREIAQGAERFVNGARFILQARCVQLARMGCVVFHYDMIGRADSQQIPEAIGHFYAARRPHMETSENWGFFSPQAELRLQSVMGLQTYNSVRSLDFLCELPDVDTSRIGVTGASGGGTQTFILGAIDPRPVVAFPAVMVSTAMQGGCTCENCSLLRIGTGNVEFAALFAPKPMGLTAANDWTRQMATKGAPELKKLYKMLGAEDHVALYSMTQFGHNYNHPSREAMYQWFNRHLRLDLEEPVAERDFVPLTIDELTVWNADHPKPKGGEDYERSLLRVMTEDSERQLAKLVPQKPESLSEFREVVSDAWKVMVAHDASPMPQDTSRDVALKPDVVTKFDRDGYTEYLCLLKSPVKKRELPLIRLEPASAKTCPLVLWISPEGKAGLFDSNGQLRPSVRKLLDAGRTVVGVDLLYQGEFLADGKSLQKARRVGNDRDAAAFTFGYNPSVFAYRVQDLLDVIGFFKQPSDQAKPQVELFGGEGAGHLVAVAAALEGVNRTAIDTAGFRFANVPSTDHPDFQPGGAKYFDLPGAVALIAPARLFIRDNVDKTADPHIVSLAYTSAGASDKLTSFQGSADEFESAAVEWLLSD